MFLYYLQRIFIAIALLGAGGFCFYKMVTVKPHRLKKEEPYDIAFRDDLPDEVQGEELARFPASRSNLIGTVIFGMLIVVFLVAAVHLRDFSFAVFLIPSTFVFFHTLDEGTKSVGIYPTGIEVRSALRKKRYSFRALSHLKSYNVLNPFHKGISYGYCFWENDRQIISLDIRQYPQAAQIESVFASLPEVVKNSPEL